MLCGLFYNKFRVSDFYARVTDDGFRLLFQFLRMRGITFKFPETAGIIVAGFYPVVCGHLKRKHPLFLHDFAYFGKAFFRLSDGNKKTGGSKIVDVMINRLQPDRSKICQKQRSMKGTSVDYAKGQRKMPVPQRTKKGVFITLRSSLSMELLTPALRLVSIASLTFLFTSKISSSRLK